MRVYKPDCKYSEPDCIHNEGVGCRKVGPQRCVACGWNSDVHRRRVAKIRKNLLERKVWVWYI